jgi:aryl-alcohol dehydrogenase-like predicted oxidoreductase
MVHAIAYRSQASGQIRVPALEAASGLGLAAFGSASLLQGRLAGAELPDAVAVAFPEADSSARQALQFARSAPGLTAALVGVSSPEHRDENFGLTALAPAEPGRILALLDPDGN